MKPITISPSQSDTMSHITGLHAHIAKVDMSMAILACHPDPVVQSALAPIKRAIDAWTDSKTRFAEALVDRSGIDLIDLDLSSRNYCRITNLAGLVVLDHHDQYGVRIELDRRDGIVAGGPTDSWLAVSPAPERMKPTEEHWDKWRWTLNGATVEPQVKKSVKVGDVIGFGQAQITLTCTRRGG